MALILDHVNGVGDDNRLENLRILCPNCAATLDTHCGRKNLRAKSERVCARCGKQFMVRYQATDIAPNAADAGHPTRAAASRAPERRKVDRPPLEQLEREITALGHLGTGRKYGVSDNAVRKWVASYRRQRQARADEAA